MSRRRDKKAKTESPKCEGHAIAANLSLQVPNNSWGLLRFVYVDIAFCCRDCGKEEVWTAEQQRCYYEVAKGTLYATAVRCRACRNRINDAKSIQREQMRKSLKNGRNNNPKAIQPTNSKEDGNEYSTGK
ncbi:MAG: zinc-ribbon domain containing protein [Aureliella sp.]